MKAFLQRTFGLDALLAPDDSSLPTLTLSGKRFASALFCGLVTLAIGAPGVSNAGTSYNGWNYAIDSFSDGSGGAGFEERGLAFRQVGQTGYFAMSGDLPLAGVPYGALNGSVALGDLYLNFSSHNLDTLAEFTDPNVFAIRFAKNNDSLGNLGGSNTTLGLFRNVIPTSLMLANSGYGTLQAYLAGHGAASHAMGDLNTVNDVEAYFGDQVMYPNIGPMVGTNNVVVSGISDPLERAQLAGLGLDFAHFGADAGDSNGNRVFGFSFDLSALPTGNFTAHFFEECINDGIALSGNVVPEPGTLALLGLTLAGIPLGRRRR